MVGIGAFTLQGCFDVSCCNSIDIAEVSACGQGYLFGASQLRWYDSWHTMYTWADCDIPDLPAKDHSTHWESTPWGTWAALECESTFSQDIGITMEGRRYKRHCKHEAR